MILSSSDIHKHIKEKRLVINPFHKDTVRENGIDLRLGSEIARLKRTELIFDTHGCHVNYYRALLTSASS